MTIRFCLSYDLGTDSRVPSTSRHLPHHQHILLFQKARQAYLAQFGYTERDIEGFGMFIVDVHCTYKREIFHQDKIDIKCGVDEVKGRVFSMSYTIERDGILCALGASKNVCVDPVFQKAIPLPQSFVAKISQYEKLVI